MIVFLRKVLFSIHLFKITEMVLDILSNAAGPTPQYAFLNGMFLIGFLAQYFAFNGNVLVVFFSCLFLQKMSKLRGAALIRNCFRVTK